MGVAGRGGNGAQRAIGTDGRLLEGDGTIGRTLAVGIELVLWKLGCCLSLYPSFG